jgi:hypothetical protein
MEFIGVGLDSLIPKGSATLLGEWGSREDARRA